VTDRWTQITLREELKEDSRRDAMQRRSSGFRYWLLVPFTSFIFYGSIARAFFAGLLNRIRAWSDARHG
jgi:hypothetical protein